MNFYFLFSTIDTLIFLLKSVPNHYLLILKKKAIRKNKEFPVQVIEKNWLKQFAITQNHVEFLKAINF